MGSELSKLLIEYTYYSLVSMDMNSVSRMDPVYYDRFSARHEELYRLLVPYISSGEERTLEGPELRMFYGFISDHSKREARKEKEWDEQTA